MAGRNSSTPHKTLNDTKLKLQVSIFSDLGDGWCKIGALQSYMDIFIRFVHVQKSKKFMTRIKVLPQRQRYYICIIGPILSTSLSI